MKNQSWFKAFQALPLLAALLLIGCGGGDERPVNPKTTTTPPPPPPPPPPPSTCTPPTATGPSVSVKDAPYNAKGDGVTDDTLAIQAAVDAIAGTGGTVNVPAGTYMINAVYSSSRGVVLKSSMSFVMAAGATLKAKPNASNNYAVVEIDGAHDVNIVGGVIEGERSAHTGTTGEQGHGLTITGSARNINVIGVTARECWGDGFHVSFCTSVSFCNVLADHNRRQGMSITSGDGITIRDSVFQNTAGTLPEDGLDIEPNLGETVNNVLIKGCTFKDNAGFGLESGVPLTLTGTAFVTNVVIDANTCTGNGINTKSTSPRAGIEASNSSGQKIQNNTCTNNLGYGILVRTAANYFFITGNTVSSNYDGIVQDTCIGNTITGNLVTNNTGHGIYSAACTGGTIAGNTVQGNGRTP